MQNIVSVIQDVIKLLATLRKNIALFIFSCILYYIYTNKNFHNDNLWTYYSNAPYYGNLAFPDFSAIYYVSFLQYPNIIIKGYIPTTKINLYSISIYNCFGEIIFYYDDTHTNNSSNYELEIFNLPKAYMVVVRMYRKNKNDLLDYYLPDIYNVDIKLNRVFYLFHSTKNKRNVITNNITNMYNNFMKKRKLPDFDDINYKHFYYPKISTNTNIYFKNIVANYLLLKVSALDNQIIKITGKIPPLGCNKQNLENLNKIRYICFMCCNTITTVTDDCFGTENIENNKEYTIFCMCENTLTSINSAIDNGYDKNNNTHKLLFWDINNKNRVVIYREINMSNNELSVHKNNDDNFNNDYNDIKKIMGEYYPKVTCITY